MLDIKYMLNEKHKVLACMKPRGEDDIKEGIAKQWTRAVIREVRPVKGHQ